MTDSNTKTSASFTSSSPFFARKISNTGAQTIRIWNRQNRLLRPGCGFVPLHCLQPLKSLFNEQVCPKNLWRFLPANLTAIQNMAACLADPRLTLRLAGVRWDPPLSGPLDFVSTSQRSLNETFNLGSTNKVAGGGNLTKVPSGKLAGESMVDGPSRQAGLRQTSRLAEVRPGKDQTQQQNCSAVGSLYETFQASSNEQVCQGNSQLRIL